MNIILCMLKITLTPESSIYIDISKNIYNVETLTQRVRWMIKSNESCDIEALSHIHRISEMN